MSIAMSMTAAINTCNANDNQLCQIVDKSYALDINDADCVAAYSSLLVEYFKLTPSMIKIKFKTKTISTLELF